MVTGSTAMPSGVLISDSPSAPAATQARASATISVTSGDSLANTGTSCRALARTAATTAPAACASAANIRPASSALGQERLTSIAVTPAASDSLAASPAYSRTIWPAMETTTRAPRDSSHGRSRRRNASMPGPCRPTAFSRPLGVSASLGGGLPVHGSAMIDLLTSAPSLATSMKWATSRPAPAQPEAASTGFGSSARPSLVRMSTGMAVMARRRDPRQAPAGRVRAGLPGPARGGLPGCPPGPGRAQRVEGDRPDVVPADQVTAEDRPVDARADDPGDPVRPGHRQHAAHAHPGAAGHRHVHGGLHRDGVLGRQRAERPQRRHRGARVDDLGARLVDDLLQQVGHRAPGAERPVGGRDGHAAPGPARGERAEDPVGAGAAEQEIDRAAAVPQPRRQRQQRRAAVADADEQAA